MEKKFFIEDKEEFLKFRASWRNFVNEGGHPTATQHLMYNAIRSVSPFRGFSKGTNKNKFDSNEYGEWNGYFKAFSQFQRVSKYDLKNLALEILKPFGIEDKDECAKLVKRAYEEIADVPLPE